MKFDDQFTDPSLFDRLHTKGPVAVAVDRAGDGNLSGEIEYEAGDGDVLALGNLEPQLLFDAIDVGLTVDQPAMLSDTYDGRLFVFVELVVEIRSEERRVGKECRS